MEPPVRILVVDDEPSLLKALRHSLEREGYQVVTAPNGSRALQLAKDQDFDLLILDLMLPEVDGLAVCRQVRLRSNLPIIMLTARSEDLDKIIGLEMGADDYVTKPFNMRELLARVKALLRRSRAVPFDNHEVVTIEDLQVDLARQRVLVRGREVELTAREFAILQVLVRHPGRVYHRSDLIKLVWGYEQDSDDRTIDVHIRRLREKLELDSSRPNYILTKWGVGYYFNDRLEPPRERGSQL